MTRIREKVFAAYAGTVGGTPTLDSTYDGGDEGAQAFHDELMRVFSTDEGEGDPCFGIAELAEMEDLLHDNVCSLKVIIDGFNGL